VLEGVRISWCNSDSADEIDAKPFAIFLRATE